MHVLEQMPVSVWPSLSLLYDGTMKSVASVKGNSRTNLIVWLESISLLHTQHREQSPSAALYVSSPLLLTPAKCVFEGLQCTLSTHLQPPSMNSLISVLVHGAVPKGYTAMRNEIFGPRGICPPDFPENCSPLCLDLHSTSRPPTSAISRNAPLSTFCHSEVLFLGN